MQEHDATEKVDGSDEQNILSGSNRTEAVNDIRDNDTLDGGLSVPPKKEKKKKRKKKGKMGSKVSLLGAPLVSLQTGSRKTGLDIHARVYALGSKYDAPQVRNVALAKFESDVHHAWNQVGFTEAINTAFRTAPEDGRLRHFIESTIVQKGSELANDNYFEQAVRAIPNLSFSLFRRKCHWADAQRFCAGCRMNFLNSKLIAPRELITTGH